MPINPVPGAKAVVFDESAAARLIVELEGLATKLDAAGRGMRLDQSEVTVDWSGFTRTWFDQQLEDVHLSTTRAAQSASVAAEQVRQARTAAQALQVRRNEEAVRARRADIARLEAVMESHSTPS